MARFLAALRTILLRRPALAPVVVRLMIAAACVAAPLRVRADVLAAGDVTPAVLDEELMIEVPDLPIGGGTVDDVIIVGGTGEQIGDTDIGSVLINNPTVTAPLISEGGIIGGEPTGTGTVTITGSGSQWRITTGNEGLIVGQEGTGTLLLQNGGQLTDDPPTEFISYDLEVIVGQQTGSQGFVTLTGNGSLLRSNELTIGEGGFGQMTVNTQTRVDTLNDAIIGNLGDTALDIGTGFVTVTGTGARWTIGNTEGSLANQGSLIVGGGGRGGLVVSAGGEVRVIDPSNTDGDITIGDTATALGEATVTGQFSQLWAFGTIFISDAQNGRGILYVQNQGVARANEGVVIASNGVLELAGGSVLTPNTAAGVISNRGVIRTAAGNLSTNIIQSVVTNEAFGEIRTAGTTDRVREKLTFLRGVTNQDNALITSIGGEMEFTSPVVNAIGGTIAGRDAVYRFNAPTPAVGLTNNGTLAFSVGASDVFGLITNTTTGVIGVANKTEATFYNDVTNNGEISVLPGGSAVFLQNLNLSPTASMSIHLNQVLNVVQLAQVDVFGALTIDGSLTVFAGGGLDPQPGDSYQIISGTSITGTFDSVFFPPAPGNNWSITYTTDSVTLNFIAAPAFNADFNGDGFIDAADLAIWRMNIGVMPATQMQGDADGNGRIDGNDFVIWQRQIGPAPAVPAIGAVPEPGSAVLSLLALVLGWRRRERKAR